MNIDQFRNVYSQEMKKENSLWVRFVIRPISFYVAYAFQRLGFKANGVSYLSIIVVFVAFTCFLIESRALAIVGAMMVQIWMILDCVDGNLARVSKVKNPYGVFVDAMSGYTMLGFVFLGIGMVAEREVSCLNQYIPDNFFILMGGIASVSTLTSRLIFQKLIATQYEFEISSDPRSNKPGGILRFLDKNIGISGLFMPAMLVAAVFRFNQIIVIFYAVYFSAVLIFCYLRFIFKVQRTKI